MRLALLPVVFLLYSQFSVAAPAPSLATDKSAKTVQTTPQAGVTATRVKLPPGQEAVRFNAGHGTPEARQAVQHTTPVKAADETENLSYGTLLATLVLMVAIAVRRSKAGRP